MHMHTKEKQIFEHDFKQGRFHHSTLHCWYY